MDLVCLVMSSVDPWAERGVLMHPGNIFSHCYPRFQNYPAERPAFILESPDISSRALVHLSHIVRHLSLRRCSYKGVFGVDYEQNVAVLQEETL